MLKGKKIYLTSIEKIYLLQLKVWRNNPDFRKYFREYRELNDETQNIWFDKFAFNDVNTIMFSIRNIVNKELLGCCGLCYIN